jgi:hypothetical protein
MHQTYELYFETETGKPQFEAATYASQVELVAELRRRLAERKAKAVEVRQFGAHLFTLAG